MSGPTAAGVRPGVSAGPSFLIVLGILMAFGPMSVDMYLPALTAIGAEFKAAQVEVQSSLSSFFLGFGIGQIFWGAMGDWLGRRRPAMAGIVLFAIACAGCSLSGSVTELTFWRFVQALGGCAGPVLARAMVRDVFEKDRAASVLSLMMLIMGIAPIIAPLIGGQLLLFSDWRMVFGVQAIFGAIAFVGILTLPETLAEENRRPAKLSAMWQGYRGLLVSRQYLGYAFCSAFIFGGMFAYISGTPYVYIQIYDVSPQTYGFLFGINILGMMTVSTINSRIVLKYGTDRVLRIGCTLAAIFGLVLAVVGATGFGGLPGLVLALLLFLSMNGMVGANSMAGAMAAFPKAAGSAAALIGTLQFGTGAIAGWIVGYLANGTPFPMCAVICVLGLGALLNERLVLGRRERV